MEQTSVEGKPISRRERTRCFHGEYKTPGGKLVVVDFAVREDLLEDVQIAGDFFLYPEDAWHRLSRALERSPVADSTANRAALLAASLAAGDELVGLTCEAIAIAVERALPEGR